MDRPLLVEREFKKGSNCAQAILSVYGKDMGLGEDEARKIASAFGGGISRSGEMCGAVIGALMVIGLKYGWTRVDDAVSKSICQAKGGEFIRRFKERNHHLTCKGLLGFDISTPQGQAEIRKKDLGKTLCPMFVRDAANILEGMI